MFDVYLINNIIKYNTLYITIITFLLNLYGQYGKYIITMFANASNKSEYTLKPYLLKSYNTINNTKCNIILNAVVIYPLYVPIL